MSGLATDLEVLANQTAGLGDREAADLIRQGAKYIRDASRREMQLHLDLECANVRLTSILAQLDDLQK